MSHAIRKWYSELGDSQNMRHEKALNVTSILYLIDTYTCAFIYYPWYFYGCQ